MDGVWFDADRVITCIVGSLRVFLIVFYVLLTCYLAVNAILFLCQLSTH